MDSHGDTMNFDRRTIDYMAEHPTEKAVMASKEIPYHLRYIRDGKPVVEPEKKSKK